MHCQNPSELTREYFSLSRGTSSESVRFTGRDYSYKGECIVHPEESNLTRPGLPPGLRETEVASVPRMIAAWKDDNDVDVDDDGNVRTEEYEGMQRPEETKAGRFSRR